MSKRVIIVESPTKARTIEKFLGKDFVVRSSFGHVRDLPDSASEIPAKIKAENKEWCRLGVDVNNDFRPLYLVPSSKKKLVKELKELLDDASELYLATDEDREGESISWHLLEVLAPKIPYKRMVFHEITKEAIEAAINSPREIDLSLVRAQETRRIIDRLFGYSVSPLLWKKIAPRLSAGRVQSVAMRLLVERERERMAFRSAQYWDLSARFRTNTAAKAEFEAELFQVGGKRIAAGKDFDQQTGKLNAGSDVLLLNEAEAKRLKESLESQAPRVESVEAKPYTSRPYAPFTTSTLQQEASRKLGFAAKRTMQVAQTLYENGFITYMRTDSTTLSEEALKGARSIIANDFGKEYLNPAPRLYQTQVKNAQEAHEAIRPAGAHFAPMESVRQRLGLEAFKLYELIWKRTIASQMKDAEGTRITAIVRCGEALFRATGKTISFAGYLRAYVEGSDDPEAELADQEKILPDLKKDEELSYVGVECLQHETKPPARYTEGSLIKELERLGIGRPSTWATIVDIVLSRDYAFKKGPALVPTFLAAVLTALMEKYFTDLVDYSFTASLEDDLDAISRGEADNLKYLREFYFGDGHPGLKGLVEQGEEKIDPREVNGIPVGVDPNGKIVEVRVGRFGPFVTNGEFRASVPNAIAPDELTLGKATELLGHAEAGPQSLGTDPETGKAVYAKNGRFGPYVQLGDNSTGEKPKMASLLPGMQLETLVLETALQLLRLPRKVGVNPDTQEEILAANGRYGPYIKCGAETRSIPADSSPLVITLEQAVALLKEPRRRGRAAAAPKALKTIGKHPTTEKELVIKAGRYGPYVTDGELNASLPRGADPSAVTIDEAVGLLEARAAKIAAEGDQPKMKPKKKASSKSGAAKKKAAKA